MLFSRKETRQILEYIVRITWDKPRLWKVGREANGYLCLLSPYVDFNGELYRLDYLPAAWHRGYLTRRDSQKVAGICYFWFQSKLEERYKFLKAGGVESVLSRQRVLSVVSPAPKGALSAPEDSFGRLSFVEDK